MMPTLWPLALATGFRDKKGDRVSFTQNRFEWVGSKLYGISCAGHVTDYVMRNIRDPLFLISSTALALIAITFVFYPHRFRHVIIVKPWMLKLSFYLCIQGTVLGIGMRTFGRLSNPQLMNDWNKDLLVAAYPGDAL